MIVNIHGTRGSVPAPGFNTYKYGGNTTCLEVTSDSGKVIIIDAGTGIRTLNSKYDATDEPLRFHLFFTHTHWDHIQGLNFFAPLFSPKTHITIYLHKRENVTLNDTLEALFNNYNFPVPFSKLPARIELVEFVPGDTFQIDNVKIETCSTTHPGGNSAYKFTENDWSFVFTGDHEGGFENLKLASFIAGAETIIVDSPYTDEHYQKNKGWGHSAYSMWIDTAIDYKIKRLFFTHHDPEYNDNKIDLIHKTLADQYAQKPITLVMAREKSYITSENHGIYRDHVANTDPYILMERLACFTEELALYNDISMILDKILLQARRDTKADAGTIYLVNNTDALSFAYIQNDTLFSENSLNKFIYSNSTIAIDETTIAGYAAHNRAVVNIEDVYNIPKTLPYSFNRTFDKLTGYKTKSMITIPILSSKKKLLGVLQLINGKDKSGKIVPFIEIHETYLRMIIVHASSAIERGIFAKEMTMRLLKLVSLRNPKETEGHFERVGAYSAAIFHRWAQRWGMEMDQINILKDQLSLAAMLHDIAMATLPDSLLIDTGNMTLEQQATLYMHRTKGAMIFDSHNNSIDEIARLVAMYYTERWDGQEPSYKRHTPLKHEQIPWSARIVAIANEFDLLRTGRIDGIAHHFDKAVLMIDDESGKKFDPEMVAAFIDILDVIKAIGEKYKN